MTQNLENIVKELHKLNFGKGGLIEFAPDGSDYDFKRLEDGKHKFDTEPDLCTLCDGCDLVQEDGTKCVFTRITHGTHTFDFLDAHGVDHKETAGWSQKPVLFVMENPGAIEEKRDRKVGTRYVSRLWYWVMGQYERPNDKFIYPNFFVQKEYGWMIYSAIRTFQMANAYVTNMVKCGMKIEEEKDKKSYLTTDEYPSKIVDTCIAERLKAELDCLRGENGEENVIVFALGERAYYHLKKELKEGLKDEKVSLYLLPHPANRLANDYRKYVLFGKILRALVQNHFYKGVEKPDFEAILAADAEETEPRMSRKEFCIQFLKDKGIKKSKEYPETIGYEIIQAKDSNGAVADEPEAVVLRQKVNGPDIPREEENYPVQRVWVKYTFSTHRIEFSVSKYSSGATESKWIYPKDEDILKKFQPYITIKEMAEAYRKEYEPSNKSDQESREE